ncbi:hypothetical protein E2320_013483, partial [Naja naja]
AVLTWRAPKAPLCCNARGSLHPGELKHGFFLANSSCFLSSHRILSAQAPRPNSQRHAVGRFKLWLEASLHTSNVLPLRTGVRAPLCLREPGNAPWELLYHGGFRERVGTEPGARVQQAIRNLYPGPLAGWVGPFLSAVPGTTSQLLPSQTLQPFQCLKWVGERCRKALSARGRIPRPCLLSPRLKCAEQPSALSSFRAVETRLPVGSGIHEET